MPPLETKDRKQDAVLLPALLVNGYPRANRKGEILLGAPTAIKVRWCWEKKESMNAKGEPVTIEAHAVVDRLVVVGSIMWLGKLANYVGTGGDAVEFMQVVDYQQATDIKNRDTRRLVQLMRYRGVLPTGN
jgi:hypothetical protein